MAFKHKIDTLNARVDRLADKLEDVLEHLGMNEKPSIHPKPPKPEPPPAEPTAS